MGSERKNPAVAGQIQPSLVWRSAMQTKVRFYDEKFPKSVNFILNILIILTGVTIQTQAFSFRYIFLISAAVFVLITIVMLILSSQMSAVISKEKILSAFMIYIFIVVTVKQIMALTENGISLSLVSGYGNVIYISFALFLMSVYSDSRKKMFFCSYITSFTGIFVFTGFNTLYDFGNVCRTISVFSNPNILAVYASVSLFASLIMIKVIKKPYRFIFVFTAAAAAAAVVNSSCRAIIFGLLISAGAAAVLFVLKEKRAPKISKESVIVWACVLILSMVLIQVYFPVPENAVIDYVNEGPYIVSDDDDVKTISGADRILNNDQIRDPASYKENLRFVIWKGYAEKINDYFWFGTSSAGKERLYIDALDVEYAPHNILVYTFYEYGIFGFILFCLLLIRVCCMIIRMKSLSRTWILTLICLGTLVLFGLLHDAVNKSMFWIVVTAFLFVREPKNSHNLQSSEI